MAQYHAHVNRLKEAIDEPPQASFASEAINAESTDASEVIANVEAQLVGEAASHAAEATTDTQRPPAAMFHPPVPNSTRSALYVHSSATCMMPVADRWRQAYTGTGRLTFFDSLHPLGTKGLRLAGEAVRWQCKSFAVHSLQRSQTRSQTTVQLPVLCEPVLGKPQQHAACMLQTSLCIRMHTLHCIHLLIATNQALVCLVMLIQMLRYWLVHTTSCSNSMLAPGAGLMRVELQKQTAVKACGREGSAKQRLPSHKLRKPS